MASGKIFIILGLILFVLGLLISYAPNLINWFGKLPGDIHIEDENKSIYFPITSMIIISILLSIAANLFFRK